MNKFGTCVCNINRYEPVISDLQRFGSYEEAFAHYLQNMFYPNTYRIRENFWLVWIEKDRVIQFENLMFHDRCKIVKFQ